MHENIQLEALGVPQITREVLLEAERLDKDVYLLLAGANLGNPKEQIDKAAKLVELAFDQSLIRSRMYKSAAWGFESEDYFLNQAWILQSNLKSIELLGILKSIEKQMGRSPKVGDAYQSRLIDIDILLHGNEIIESEQLSVPHLLMQERKFALAPAKDLIPNVIHPIIGENISDLNDRLVDEIHPS